jgi:hypothetical protein
MGMEMMLHHPQYRLLLVLVMQVQLLLQLL